MKSVCGIVERGLGYRGEATIASGLFTADVIVIVIEQREVIVNIRRSINNYDEARSTNIGSEGIIYCRCYGVREGDRERAVRILAALCRQ